jgi:hypothetical protein
MSTANSGAGERMLRNPRVSRFALNPGYDYYCYDPI